MKRKWNKNKFKKNSAELGFEPPPPTTKSPLTTTLYIESFEWWFYNYVDLTCDYKYPCASCFQQYNGKILPLFVNRTVPTQKFFGMLISGNTDNLFRPHRPTHVTSVTVKFLAFLWVHVLCHMIVKWTGIIGDILTTSWENLSYVICEQQRRKSVCAVCSAPLLFAALIIR